MITFEQVTDDIRHVLLSGSRVGQHYQQTGNVCLVRKVSEAGQYEIKQRITADGMPFNKIIPPPPEIPERWQR